MKELKLSKVDNILLAMLTDYFKVHVKTAKAYWEAIKAFELFFLSSTGMIPKGNTFAGGKFRFMIEMTAAQLIALKLQPAIGQRNLEESGIDKFCKIFKKKKKFLVPILITNDTIKIADGDHRYAGMDRAVRLDSSLGSKTIMIMFGDFTYDEIRELNDNQNGWKKKHHFQHGLQSSNVIIKQGYKGLLDLKAAYPYMNYNELMMLMYKSVKQAFDDASNVLFREGNVYWGAPSVNQLCQKDADGNDAKDTNGNLIPVDPHEDLAVAKTKCAQIDSFGASNIVGKSATIIFTKNNSQYGIKLDPTQVTSEVTIDTKMPFMDKHFIRAWIRLQSDQDYDHALMLSFLADGSYRTGTFIKEMAIDSLINKHPIFFTNMKTYYMDKVRERIAAGQILTNNLTVTFELEAKKIASLQEKAIKRNSKRPDAAKMP